MCGIAGAINFQLDIPLLTKDLYHRGPDEQKTFTDDNLILAHHRLSILDISGGAQPMHYKHFTIIFNGEIYNHLEVRKKLNLNCRTHSDTETILMAYEKLGADCLHEFDGMFALAIYDKQKKQLFLTRDRAGKKPLYYYQDKEQFVFCSELLALKNQLPLLINENNIFQFIRLGYFYKTATPYQNVNELQAGSYATIDLQHPIPQVFKWWNIHQFYEKPVSDDFETAMQKTEHYLHEAVRNRVESSDLEVGSFLSGGIDSGLVTAIAKQYNSTLKTFTVSFDGEYDEAPLAKLVAEKYNTDHYEIRIGFDNLVNDIEKIISNYGEPFFDSSAIPSYYVSQAAKKHLTVILNGDGGDEIFGGYRRYVPFAKYDFFNANLLIKSAASAIKTLLPVSNNKKSKYNYLYRLADLARKSKLDVYLTSTTDIFEGYQQYIKSELEYLAPVKRDFEQMNKSSLSGLQKIMNLDFDNILPGVLLVKIDIATMRNSLEGRSPLLSKNILEYIPSVSDKFKIKGAQTKYLLREMSKKYLPQELVNQPKRGFEPPMKNWVNHELKDIIGDYIHSVDAFYPSFFDKKFVLSLLNNEIKAPAEKRSKMLWLIFALEVWHKKVYKIN